MQEEYKMTHRKVTIAVIAAASCCVSQLTLLSPAAADADSQEATRPAPSSTASLDEIMVTARKREERDIDVPTSVQAFSAETLEKKGISSVTDLYATVPSLYFSSNVLSGGRDLENLVIRGIGAESAGPPAVATFVDGVYQPSLAFDTDFLDVDAVEVLKGPQGTIFGRNAEAGALNITLKKPDATPHAAVAVTYDNFQTERLQGKLSGPLSDVFFGDVSLDASHTEGYLTDPTLGGASADHNRKFNGRVALRFKPNDQLDVNFSIDGSEQKGPEPDPGVPRGLDKWEVLNYFLPDSLDKSLGGALNIAYDFGDFKFTSLTGARRLYSSNPYDFSGGPVGGVEIPYELSNLHSRQYSVSQEFRLSGAALNNRLNWLAGAYYFQEGNTEDRLLDLSYLPLFGTSYTSPAQNQNLVTKGESVFADGTYDLTSRLSLDVGLRYGRERQTSSFFQDATIPGIIYIDTGASGAISTAYTTPSVSLLYHITPDATVYGRYAKGVRAAGFPLSPTPTADIPYKAEYTNNYEVGFKGRVLDGVLGYDLSAYYIKIINQQVTSVIFLDNNPNLPAATVTNVGASSSRGVEANVDIRPIKDLAFTANLGYTDAHYDDYISSATQNLSGQALPFVPHWTADTTAAYTFDLPPGRPTTLTAEYQHVGSILSGSGVGPDLQFNVKAYDLVNLRSSTALTDQLKLDFFCKNLLNRFIETKVFNDFFFVEPRPFSTVLPPRNYGVRLSYSF
jgi:iron complex outermembrane receptor protein